MRDALVIHLLAGGGGVLNITPAVVFAISDIAITSIVTATRTKAAPKDAIAPMTVALIGEHVAMSSAMDNVTRGSLTRPKLFAVSSDALFRQTFGVVAARPTQLTMRPAARPRTASRKAI